MVWVGECLRVRSCLYARVFVHELLYAYSTCVLTIFGVCACMCLDYLIENLPIDGSYSSATSSQAGQFVLCKKKQFSEYFSFFPSGVSPPIFYNPDALLQFWSIGGRCRPPNQKES